LEEVGDEEESRCPPPGKGEVEEEAAEEDEEEEEEEEVLSGEIQARRMPRAASTTARSEPWPQRCQNEVTQRFSATPAARSPLPPSCTRHCASDTHEPRRTSEVAFDAAAAGAMRTAPCSSTTGEPVPPAPAARSCTRSTSAPARALANTTLLASPASTSTFSETREGENAAVSAAAEEKEEEEEEDDGCPRLWVCHRDTTQSGPLFAFFAFFFEELKEEEEEEPRGGGLFELAAAAPFSAARSAACGGSTSPPAAGSVMATFFTSGLSGQGTARCAGKENSGGGGSGGSGGSEKASETDSPLSLPLLPLCPAPAGPVGPVGPVGPPGRSPAPSFAPSAAAAARGGGAAYWARSLARRAERADAKLAIDIFRVRVRLRTRTSTRTSTLT
jgi:hypothetical protein